MLKKHGGHTGRIHKRQTNVVIRGEACRKYRWVDQTKKEEHRPHGVPGKRASCPPLERPSGKWPTNSSWRHSLPGWGSTVSSANSGFSHLGPKNLCIRTCTHNEQPIPLGGIDPTITYTASLRETEYIDHRLSAVIQGSRRTWNSSRQTPERQKKRLRAWTGWVIDGLCAECGRSFRWVRCDNFHWLELFWKIIPLLVWKGICLSLLDVFRLYCLPGEEGNANGGKARVGFGAFEILCTWGGGGIGQFTSSGCS